MKKLLFIFLFSANIAQAQFYPVNAHPQDVIYTVLADQISQKLYYGGSMLDSTDGFRCPGMAYYDFVTQQADTIHDGRVLSGGDVRMIKRLGSQVYGVGMLGYLNSGQQYQGNGFFATDGNTWSFPAIGYTAGSGSFFDAYSYNDTMIFGGNLTSVAGEQINMVAGYTANHWFSFPFLANGAVTSILKYNNELYVAGGFSSPINNIARFDGTGWRSLPHGPNSGFVTSMTDYNGLLVVGGYFFESSGDPGNCIAAWNGNSWTKFGDGLPFVVRCLAVFQGELYAGGDFTTSTVSSLAKWDGVNWIPVDGALCNGAVTSMSVMGNSLFLGGAFTQIGNQPMQYLAEYKVTVGLSENSTTPVKLKTFPNPAKEKCYVVCPDTWKEKTGKTEIINSTGQIVYRKDFLSQNDKIEIALPQLATGLYQIIIHCGNELGRSSLLIE